MQRIARVLFPLGLLATPFLVGISHSHRGPNPYPFGTQNSYSAYLVLGLIHLLVGHVAGVPDEVEDMQPAFARSLLSAAISTSVWVVVQTISPGLLPRWVVFVVAAVAGGWSFFCSTLTVRGRRKRLQREQVVAILGGAEIGEFNSEVEQTFPPPEIAFNVTTAFDFEQTGSDFDLEAAVRCDVPNLVVLSDAAGRSAKIVDVVTNLHREGVKVRTLSAFYDEYLGKISLSELTRMSMLFDVRNLHHPTYRRFKRLIDLFGGVVASLFCFLVLPAVALGNVLGNRGPVLFRQPRVGLNGEVFSILKFRTMIPTAEEEVGSWTRHDDPRVTSFGRVMRRMHIDELPQFWNILKGDLSLVGPRPEQPKYVYELSAKEPAYDLRHLVMPGLTGWAQIKLRYADTEAAAIEKLQYDLYYLQHQSLALDLRILSRTIRSVLRRRGR